MGTVGDGFVEETKDNTDISCDNHSVETTGNVDTHGGSDSIDKTGNINIVGICCGPHTSGALDSADDYSGLELTDTINHACNADDNCKVNNSDAGEEYRITSGTECDRKRVQLTLQLLSMSNNGIGNEVVPNDDSRSTEPASEHPSGVGQYKCMYCQETFRRRYVLDEHIEVIHTENQIKRRSHEAGIQNENGAVKMNISDGDAHVDVRCGPIDRRVHDVPIRRTTDGHSDYITPYSALRRLLSETKHGRINRDSRTDGITQRQFHCIYCPASFTQLCRLESHTERFHQEHDTEELQKHNNSDRNCDLPENFFKMPNVDTSIQDSSKKSDVLTDNQIIAEKGIENSNADTDVLVEHYMKRLAIGSEPICKFCGTTVSSTSDLRIHLKTHVKTCIGILKFTYPCNICNKYYETRNSLKRHVRIHTGDVSDTCTTSSLVAENEIENNNADTDVFVENYYMKTLPNDNEPICNYCENRFSSLSDLRIHMKTHVMTCKEGLKFTYPCDICNRNYNTRSSLKRHVRIHTGDVPDTCATGTVAYQYVCGYCQKVFRISSELKKHLQTHILKGYLQCEICYETFRDFISLKKHTNKHDIHPDKDVNICDLGQCTCDTCGKFFTRARASKFEIHILRHYGIKPYSCQVCHTKFYEYSNLRLHSHRHIGQGVYTCVKCSKVFRKYENLKDHLRLKHGETAMICRYCPEVFIDPIALNRHSSDHRRTANTCKICGKSFQKHYKLLNHELTHSMDRKFKCKECHKLFKSSSTLHTHSVYVHMIHKPGGAPKTQCRVCEKSCATRSFGLHMKSHSLKKFQCDKCNKLFTLKHHLSNHLLSHNETRDHVCDICGYQFKMAHHMRSHMKLHASSAVQDS